MFNTIVFFALLVLFSGFQVEARSGKNIHGKNFIKTKGTRFVLNGKPFYLNGFNSYWLMYQASDPSTINTVNTTLQQASTHGMNVARTWAFSDGGYRSLQSAPGVYNEDMFKVLYTSYVSVYMLIFIFCSEVYNLVHYFSGFGFCGSRS